MNAKTNNEKRILRGYKVADSHYNKAMRRASKEKGHLANILENVVIAYAAGLDIKAAQKDAFKEGVEEAMELVKKVEKKK